MSRRPSGKRSDKSDETPADPVREAARRMLDTVARWRAEASARHGSVICVERSNAHSGSVVRINPGPRLLAADLDTVASAGPAGASMVEKLRAWSDADHAEERGPADALGFLRALADHGEAEAVRRWPVTPARDPGTPPISEDQLSETDAAIAKAIRASPGIIGRHIADRTHVSPENVRKRLAPGMPLHALGFRCPVGRKGYDPPKE